MIGYKIPDLIFNTHIMASVNCENRRGNGNNLRVHFELPEDEDNKITYQQHSCSPISSDSDSDSDSSQEWDAKSKEDQSMNTFESDPASAEFSSSTFSTEFNYPSPVWSFQNGPYMQSPQIQVMGQASGYDPNRIPLSAFSSKSASPVEWSVGSNESLFSLHRGNSFSKDVLSWKSGEFPVPTTLPRVEEKFQSKDAEVERHSVSSESSQESVNVENHSKSISEELLSEEIVQSKDAEIERISVSTESSEQSADVVMEKHSELRENSAETATILSHQTPEDYNKEATAASEKARSSISLSHHSASTKINTSFQFPALAGRENSAKTESEKQHPETPLQPPSPKTETQTQTQQNHGVLNWFNCFSCCSPCYRQTLK